MSKIKILRQYNEFLKKKYSCDGYMFDSDLLEYLDSTGEYEEDAPLMRLELSPRAHNILMRANIYTVGQLKKLSDTELMSIRNMGKKSFDEIKGKLREI